MWKLLFKSKPRFSVIVWSQEKRWNILTEICFCSLTSCFSIPCSCSGPRPKNQLLFQALLPGVYFYRSDTESFFPFKYTCEIFVAYILSKASRSFCAHFCPLILYPVRMDLDVWSQGSKISFLKYVIILKEILAFCLLVQHLYVPVSICLVV